MDNSPRVRAGDLYRRLVHNLPHQAVLLLDDALRIVSAEGGDRYLLGDDPAAVVGRALTAAIPSTDPLSFQSSCHAAIAGEPRRFEVETSGRVYDAWAAPLHDPSMPAAVLALTLHEITSFKREEKSRQRAERAFRTLRACSRALLRASTEADLLQLICQIAVETDGYAMAWVGFAERDEEKWLRPVAWSGRIGDYLGARHLTWADTAQGQRPGPMCVRRRETVIVQRIATDPAYEAWRDEAAQLGYASALAAPLLDDEGRAFGCLTFYSDEPDAFDEREARLLTDLTNELAYGIRALRNADMRTAMVSALQESEARFRMLAENSFGGIYIIQDGRYSYVNPAFARMFGFTRKEMLSGMLVSDRVHPNHQRRVADRLRERETGEIESVHYTIECIRKDGSSIFLEALGSAVEYQGKPAVVGMAIDVTERIWIEQAEREQRLLAEALAATAAALINVLDMNGVLQEVIDGLSRVLDFDLIMIMSGRDGVMRQVFMRSSAGSRIDQQPVQLDVSQAPILARMAQTCKAVVVPDIAQDGAWIPLPGGAQAGAFAGAPICFEKTSMGFVGVFSGRPGAFDQTHGGVVQAFADQAAMALRNVDLYRELNTYNEFLEDAIESATEEMRRVKEQMEGIVLNNPNPVLLLASDGSIKLSNPALHRLFGYDTVGLRGRPPQMLIAPRDQAVLDGAIQALMAQQTTLYLDLHAARSDASEFEIRMALAPILNHERLIGIVCDIHDVTTFKEVERLKDEFVSNVSHELRTPITSMRLNAALMQRNPANQAVYLDRQMRDVDRLSHLIEDLLQLSRLDQHSAAISLQPLDLTAWAASLIDEFVMLAQDNQLALTFEPGPELPPVSADGGLLRHVLSNLLGNAINYTPPGGSIVVTMLQRSQGSKKWVGFSVRDTGPGISQEDQERLFERFYRGRVGRASHAPGTGLGLPIVREILDLHGGQVDLESSGIPGQGATFRVWLPAIRKRARKAKSG